jgi:uncharacterized protein YeaO (DUF488 family)
VGRIRPARVGDHPAPSGWADLVERAGSRAVRRESSPSTAASRRSRRAPSLRRWFALDPAEWEVGRGYRQGLDGQRTACRDLADAAAAGDPTWPYSARDTVHTSAVGLRQYLEEQIAR